jgi:poly(3-hydroxybutyrate) depolymerase
MHASVATLLAFVLALSVSTAADVDKKTAKQIEARIELYFAQEGRTRTGHAERTRLLHEIEELAPDALSAKQAKSWRKRIFDQWEDGPKLPKKTGREHFWEDEKLGLYIIGGVTKKPKGLLIGMHGGGIGTGDCGEAAGFLSSAAKKRRWAAIFPEVLEKTEHGWTTSGTEEWVMELVDRARRTYGVDANHVFFAGHSMGGFGSWTLGAHHADRVAALGPAAGAPTPYVNKEGVIFDIEDGVVPNLRNVPMRVYQSRDDPQVPAAANQVAVQKVAEAKQLWGGYDDFEYSEVNGKGHAYPPGGGKDWLEALSEFERDPHPTKVVWQPWLSWKRQFYWLYWEVPEKSAIVVAEVVEKNLIRIESEADLKGLWVLLQPELVDIESDVIVEVNGEQVWSGVPERKLSTLVLTGVFGDEGLCTALRVPAFASGGR